MTRLMTLIALLAVALLVGCGGDDNDNGGGNGNGNGNGSSNGSAETDGGETSANGDAAVEAFPPTVVKDADIQAQKEGSPERALFEWWQSFQFSDPAGVRSRTAQPTINAFGAGLLSRMVEARGQGLPGLQVLGVTVDGNSASVRGAMLTFKPKKEGGPPPKEPTSSRPITVTMKKSGGEWRFAETALLAPMVQSYQQAQQAQQEGEEQP